MKNKYLKYIYAILVFYFIWLFVVPFGFKYSIKPVFSQVEKMTGLKPYATGLKITTGIIPNLKIEANEINLYDKNCEVLHLVKPEIDIRILSLITGKIHINSFEACDFTSKLTYSDKFYLGTYSLEINPQNNCIIDKVNIKTGSIYINKNGITNLISEKDFYYKSTKKSLLIRGEISYSADKDTSYFKFKIHLPDKKNLAKVKCDIDMHNFSLRPFSDIISKYVCKDIEKLDGRVNLKSNNIQTNAILDNFKIIYKDKNKSIIFPEKFEVKSNYYFKKNCINIDDCICHSGDKNINTKLSGSVKNISSKTPYFDLTLNLKDTDARCGALMLPPIITPDISVPKLKQYPFYGNVSGDIKIKGKLPKPDVLGDLKITNGIIIKPIPNTSKGADININFVGQKLLLDVVVPAGGKEIVYVTGDITLYDETYANLKVKTSNNINLNLAEHVLNPLHEILRFLIGPVPIMDIDGSGNANLKIVGTKRNPHLWGDFNFYNAEARFLDIHNMTLKNASGKLSFNDQNAYFINKTGFLHSQPIEIKGTCTVYGDLDFDVRTDNQNLSDLITALISSPMLEPMKTLIPPVKDVKGKSDFYLNLKGKIADINKIEINKTVFPKGQITLYDDSINLNGVNLNKISGIIDYEGTDCRFDTESVLSKNSKLRAKGRIKNNIAEVSVDAPKIYVNELDREKLSCFDDFYAKLSAKYKGRLNKIEIDGLNSVIEIIKDGRPITHKDEHTATPPLSHTRGKVLSGKITIKNSNLDISNLKGYLRQNPFSLNLSVKNLGKKELDLTKSRFDGNLNCKEFDFTALNYIKNAKILPENIQKELDKVNIIEGSADINAKIKNNQLNSNMDVDNIRLEYSMYTDSNKGESVIPIKLISGQFNVKNNVIYLDKLNCLADSMPVLVSGKINNIYKNPEYFININSVLIRKVFDKYWNAHNIYPIKMNGNISYSSTITGNKNHTRIISDIELDENSSIYYMGAVIGDTLNPITVNLDADIRKDGVIKLNKFKYNKLIASQNNKLNALPVLSVAGELKKQGKIYALKDLTVKTESSANANLFNIIFKKPTIKSGNFTSDIKINGTSNHPKIIGKFDVNNLEMPYLNTTIKDLSLDFKPDDISITTKGEVFSNHIMINAKIKNNLTPPYRINGADIYINDLDINHSLSLLKQLELNGLSSAISPDTDTTGADLLNSTVFSNVKIRAGNIQVKNIKASNLEAVCSLDERMHLAVETFKFNMASGIITGKIGYNLLNNFMKMELNAKEVNANELTIALFDLPNQIFGSLTGRIDLSCNATNDKTKTETLNGYGTFSVTDGRMPKLGSLEYLLKAGNLLKGGITGLTINNIIDIVTPMKTGGFSSINGQLRIKDGVAKTVEIRSLGKDLNIYIIGQMNFITKTADMKVFGQISRKISTILGATGNISLNTLFNKIPGINLDKDNSFINDINKIPGIELSDKTSRRFMVEILGDINGDDFVRSFRWIN